MKQKGNKDKYSTYGYKFCTVIMNQKQQDLFNFNWLSNVVYHFPDMIEFSICKNWEIEPEYLIQKFDVSFTL